MKYILLNYFYHDYLIKVDSTTGYCYSYLSKNSTKEGTWVIDTNLFEPKTPFEKWVNMYPKSIHIIKKYANEEEMLVDFFTVLLNMEKT